MQLGRKEYDLYVGLLLVSIFQLGSLSKYVENDKRTQFLEDVKDLEYGVIFSNNDKTSEVVVAILQRMWRSTRCKT